MLPFQRMFAAILLVAAAARPCLGATDLWDAGRYMRVSEVRPGMTGYGLSVFSGSRIDRFDVEVIDVLRNLVNPKSDVVLVTCKGDYLNHVGPVEGMSGSPIYLYDVADTQHLHPRMIGAFAYGWEWAKDPIGGVQPIEYMLKIQQTGSSAIAKTNNPPSNEFSRPRWSLRDVPALPGFHRNAAGLTARSLSQSTVEAGRMRELATPLMATSLPARAARELSPMFAQCGLDLLDGGASGAAIDQANIALAPGAVLVAPLLTGDMELTAIGTCTEVRGNRVFGFGHEFNNEGPIDLPMGSGKIATVVADVHSSFKLGALAQIVGTLTNDQSAGIAGNVGQAPPMVPVQLHIHYADGSLDQTYNFQAAVHPKFTPLAVASAVEAAMAGVKDVPEFQTLDYHLILKFADGKTVAIDNKSINGGAMEVVQQLTLPIMAAAENPFAKVPVTDVSGTVDVTEGDQLAAITSITLPKLKYAPGDVVKAFVTLLPWRGGEETLPITFELPHDLPDGDYQLVVSDWERYFNDQRQAEPFRFTAQSIDELFAVVKDFEAIRHDALYVRLVRQADGVAVGRAAMPRLPSGFRDVLLDAGRSNLSAFVSSSVKTIPTDWVMSGSADFTLTISRESHTETARPAKPTTQP